MANTPQAKKRIRRNAQPHGYQRGADQPHPDLRQASGIGARRLQQGRGQGGHCQQVQPELARGVARGVMHKNTAARKLSRLTRSSDRAQLSGLPASKKLDVHSGGFFHAPPERIGKP